MRPDRGIIGAMPKAVIVMLSAAPALAKLQWLVASDGRGALQPLMA
jgi:hypothetical protein